MILIFNWKKSFYSIYSFLAYFSNWWKISVMKVLKRRHYSFFFEQLRHSLRKCHIFANIFLRNKCLTYVARLGFTLDCFAVLSSMKKYSTRNSFKGTHFKMAASSSVDFPTIWRWRFSFIAEKLCQNFRLLIRSNGKFTQSGKKYLFAKRLLVLPWN